MKLFAIYAAITIPVVTLCVLCGFKLPQISIMFFVCSFASARIYRSLNQSTPKPSGDA